MHILNLCFKLIGRTEVANHILLKRSYIFTHFIFKIMLSRSISVKSSSAGTFIVFPAEYFLKVYEAKKNSCCLSSMLFTIYHTRIICYSMPVGQSMSLLRPHFKISELQMFLMFPYKYSLKLNPFIQNSLGDTDTVNLFCKMPRWK